MPSSLPFATTLTLAANAQALPLAQKWLDEHMQPYDYSLRTRYALQLCLDELISNILKHGFQPVSQAHYHIVLNALFEPKYVTLQLCDNAPPFDPTKHIVTPLADSLEHAHLGGHGLRLLHHYFREIHYHYHNNHNCLRLVLDA